MRHSSSSSVASERGLLLVDGHNIMNLAHVGPRSLFAMLHVFNMSTPGWHSTIVFDGPQFVKRSVASFTSKRGNKDNRGRHSQDLQDVSMVAEMERWNHQPGAQTPRVQFVGHFAKNAADKAPPSCMQHMLQAPFVHASDKAPWGWHPLGGRAGVIGSSRPRSRPVAFLSRHSMWG